MNNDIDLKNLWQMQQTAVPEIEVLIKKIRAFKKKSLRKLVFTNILLLATVAFISYIWYAYQPEKLTTKLGIIMVIATMVFYLFVYNQMVPLLLRSDYEKDNASYLQQLLTLKYKQIFLQGTALGIYFLLLALGMCLYFVEFVMRMSLIAGLLTYGLSLAWFMFGWFYLRPRRIKKEQKKIDELISQLQQISNQLNTTDLL